MIKETVFLPYQQKWMADESDVKIAEKSRRIGLTWAEAADAVLNAASSKGRDVFYLSYNMDATKEFIETCAEWAKSFGKVASDVEEVVIKNEDEDITVYRISFPSGFKILGLPSKASTLRGKQGVVIIDEAAFCPDLKELIKAAMALLMWGGKVRIISTHNGEENLFNQLIQEIKTGKKSYSLHHITIQDALDEGLYKRICLRKNEEWSIDKENAWLEKLIDDYGEGAAEELFCIPSRGGSKYFSRSLVEACMSKEVPILKLELKQDFILQEEVIRREFIEAWLDTYLLPILKTSPDRPSYIGQDFARSGDLTVSAVATESEFNNRKLDSLFFLEMRNVPFRHQFEIDCFIIDHLKRWYSASLDARGNGQQLAEDLALKYGQAYVNQVMISQSFYLQYMPKYKARLEDREIELPYSLDIIDDHRLVAVEKGIPRIPNERTSDKNKNKRHGDSVVSAVMLEHAFASENNDYQEYEYEPVQLENKWRISKNEDW